MRHLVPSIVGMVLFAGCSGVQPQKVNQEFSHRLHFREEVYHLKPEDTISINILSHSDFSESGLRVTPDGYIDTLLGRFRVSGKTTPEVEELIAKQQTEFPETPPNIVVRLEEQAPEVVWVGGEVRTPGLVTLRPEMSAFEAIMQVGGYRPSAKLRSIILIRRTEDWKRAVKRVNLNYLEDDLVLLPRDILYVPRIEVADVAWFVDQYIYQVLPLRYLSMFGLRSGY